MKQRRIVLRALSGIGLAAAGTIPLLALAQGTTGSGSGTSSGAGTKPGSGATSGSSPGSGSGSGSGTGSDSGSMSGAGSGTGSSSGAGSSSGSGSSSGTAAASSAAAKLSEQDPQAVALGYKDDTAQVDQKKYPNHQTTQVCSGCQFYQGTAKDAQAPCTIFAGRKVAAKGWCSSYVKKAGAS